MTVNATHMNQLSADLRTLLQVSAAHYGSVPNTVTPKHAQSLPAIFRTEIPKIGDAR